MSYKKLPEFGADDYKKRRASQLRDWETGNKYKTDKRPKAGSKEGYDDNETDEERKISDKFRV